MRTLIPVIFILFVAWGCSTPQQQLPSDELFRRKIVGTWTELDAETGLYSEATFSADGDYKGAMYRTPEKRQILFTVVEGKWWIQDGKLFNKVDKIQSAELPETVIEQIVDKNKVYVDIIVDIGEDTITLIDEKGKQYVNKKVH